MSPEIGIHTRKGSGAIWHGLAGENFELISITVDEGVRDSGNINTDDLRAGYCLERDSTNGKYIEWASDHDTLVILAEPLYDLADNGDQIAQAFWSGSFYKDAIIEPATVTWTSAQRFRIRGRY